jgi:hypothetical protein
VTLAVVAISLGLIFGTWTCGICGWFLAITRERRKAKNFSIIGLGYVVAIVTFVGPVLLLLYLLDEMGISRSFLGNVGICAYLVAIGVGVLLVLRAEMRWRKAESIDSKPSLAG